MPKPRKYLKRMLTEGHRLFVQIARHFDVENGQSRRRPMLLASFKTSIQVSWMHLLVQLSEVTCQRSSNAILCALQKSLQGMHVLGNEYSILLSGALVTRRRLTRRRYVTRKR